MLPQGGLEGARQLEPLVLGQEGADRQLLAVRAEHQAPVVAADLLEHDAHPVGLEAPRRASARPARAAAR